MMIDGRHCPHTSGKLIASKASHVTILHENIQSAASLVFEQMKTANYSMDVWKSWPMHPKDMNEKTADWIFVIDSLNFSFWLPTEIQFEVEFEGSVYRDYEALCACVNRALKEGIEITTPKVYKDITYDTVSSIFRSCNGTTLPLLKERTDILRENGKILCDKYHGCFANFLRCCDHDVENALRLLLENFPSFRDYGEYKDMSVSFCKRAQILLADVWACFEGKTYGDFNNIEMLTMFPDYRVPQTLLLLKLIKYSDELRGKIKDGVELRYGSDEEIEIRGCSIHSIELLKEELLKMVEKTDSKFLINSVILDFYLWDLATNSMDTMIFPEHRTRSIFY